jgi:hypothetical protein
MKPSSSRLNLNHSRRPSKVCEKLELKKIDEARQLTLALELSDAAAASHQACSKKR